MEGAIGLFVVALLLVMQNGSVGYKLGSEGDHHVDEVPNPAFERSRDEDPKALMHEADGGKTTAGAELNTRRGHLCFLSGLLGHCRSGKKAKLSVSSITARRNAEHLQINLGTTANARVRGIVRGRGNTVPRGYRNHPPATETKHNFGSRTRPSSSLNFCMLVLAALFYSVYHYNQY